MPFIRPILTLSAAALCSSLASAEPLPQQGQARTALASLSAVPVAVPHAAIAVQTQQSAAPAPTSEAQPEQYRIAVSRITPSGLLISESAQSPAVPAHFAPPPAAPEDCAACAAPAGASPPSGPPPRRAGHFPPPPPGPLDVARLLAAQEIALGIRMDQLDLWRSYAAAVVDLADLGPPEPPKAGEPLGMSQMIAQRVLAEGRKAQVVLDTRAALLAKLTPAQIETARKLAPPRPPEGAEGPPR
ncbi:MAG: hypothetical protein AB1592_17020 [Pseudomonadota bacterium]